MRLNSKKTKSMVVSRSWTSASGYGDLTLGGPKIEKLKSVCILGVILDSKLTFEMHLWEVVSKAARNLGIIRRTGQLFDCPRVLRGFNAYVLSSLECCAPVLISSAESHLCLLDGIVERLCEGVLCCLGHIRKVSALCLLYKIYHRVDHPMNKYLKHLVAARNIRGLY